MRQDNLGLPSEDFSHMIYLAASREPSLWHYVVRDRHIPPLDWSRSLESWQTKLRCTVCIPSYENPFTHEKEFSTTYSSRT